MVLSEISRMMCKTSSQYRILEELWKCSPELVTFERMRQILWGNDKKKWPEEDGSHKKVIIYKLRKILKPHGIEIQNVCRYGYKLVFPKESENYENSIF